MPSLIQRIPWGLLAALGIKGTGRNPNELSDTVAPVIDVAGYYASPFFEIVTDTKNVQNVGDNVQLEVPAGETWRVYGIGAEMTPTTGTSYKLYVGFRAGGGSSRFLRVQAMPAVVTAVATELITISHFFAKPIVLPPGSSLIGQLQLTQATLDQMRLTAAIERLTT